MKSKKFFTTIFTIILAVSCSQPTLAGRVEYNAAQYNQITMKKGEKARLTVNYRRNVKLTSSNNKIVRVGKKGKITALKTGKVKIKVVKGKKVRKCTINVKKKLKEVTTKTVIVNSVYEDGYVKSNIKNNSDMIMMLSTPGGISRYENGEWKNVGTIEPITITGPYAYIISGDEVNLTKPLINLYDVSTPGRYRIEFTGKSINNNKSIMIYGEFEIK